MELGHHWGGRHAAFSVAWKLRHPGRRQGEIRRDVARVVGALWVTPRLGRSSEGLSEGDENASPDEAGNQITEPTSEGDPQ
jgi:hypothetical protein